MGVHRRNDGPASVGQLRDAKVQSHKKSRHGRILASKRLKNEIQRERRQAKKQTVAEAIEAPRGRAAAGKQGEAATEMKDEQMSAVRSASRPVAKGQGSGTPGARAASLKVLPAVRVSTRGGRRRKATWRSHGKG
mmetsp:Transcript_29296/g.62269  ORF Transcript_29296/g.62269 Transcript_29296/m.62269 type:complete len:135 (-) Transcript_29296:101-505(-)